METIVVPEYVRLVLIIGKEGKSPLERMAVPPWVLSDPYDPNPETRELSQDTFDILDYTLFETGADIVTTTIGRYKKVKDEAMIITQDESDFIHDILYRDYSKTCKGSTPLRSLEYELSNQEI